MKRRPPLAVAPFPVPGEHVAGYIRRLASANGLDSLRQLHRLFDVAPPSPISEPATWRKLATAAGLPLSHFDLLRWPRVGRTRERWVSVMGKAIRQRHLDLDHLKRCHSCLAEDGIVRAEWSLRHVTACPTHAVPLSDECLICGWPIPLNERTHVWHCGSCGGGLLDGEAHGASEAQIAISAALIRAMRGGTQCPSSTLPSDFDALPVADMAAVVDLLANVDSAFEESPSLSDGRRAPAPRPSEAALGSARAARMLADWPTTFMEALSELDPAGDARIQVGSSLRQFAGPVGKLLSRPPLTQSGRPIAFVADVVAAVLGSTAGYRTGQRATSSRSRASARVASATASVPISHADAMQRLEGRRDGRLARWWIDAGLLAEIRPTPDRAVFCTEEVSMLVQSIRFVADEEPRADPVDIAWIDRSVTCRDEYDKSDFLREVLDGRLGAWIVTPELEGLAGLGFSREAVLRRAALAKLRAWIRDDAHVAMFRFREVAVRVWHEDAVPRSSDARHLAAGGAVDFSYYHPPGEGRRQLRWHVGDLVALIQRSTNTIEFDVADTESARTA